jgi:hypothetical protein
MTAAWRRLAAWRREGFEVRAWLAKAGPLGAGSTKLGDELRGAPAARPRGASLLETASGPRRIAGELLGCAAWGGGMLLAIDVGNTN